MKFLGVPWWGWGVLCLGIAAVYGVVTPHDALPGLRGVIQRWGHSVAWLCFALAWFSQGMTPARSRTLGMLGLLCYLAFLVNLVLRP